MTSRRKQIKPSKAQSDPLIDLNTFSTSNLIDIKQCDEILSSMSPKILKENSEENVEIEIKCTEIKIESFETNTIENERFDIPLDDTSDDATKKIHKDDAKIVPVESNGGIDIFRCPLCSESSICGRENLTCHLQNHQNKTKRDDGKHLCCLCTKELSSNSSLERHLLTHSNHRPFSCILCEKKFTTNGNLSRHIKTSHNNNGNIGSSIDEVLKKHQMESYPVANSENSTFKFKKSNKSLKKETLNLDVLGLKGCGMNMGLLGQPFNYIHNSKMSTNTYQPTFQTQNSNINIFSPFYSFNVNDFGNIQTNISESISPLNQNNHSTLTENINSGVLKTNRNPNVLKRKQFNSLFPKRLLTVKRYRRKITFHIHNVSNTKMFFHDLNSIECVKCHSRILLTANVLPHIRHCYKFHSKNHLFCPFKLCSIKYSTIKSMLKHIKLNHLELYCHVLEPVSPLLEPLNLSIKKSSNYPSNLDYCPEILSNSANNRNLEISDKSFIKLSGYNSIAVIPNSPDISIKFPSFHNINQFISTPTIVPIAPFQFSTPMAFSTSSLLSKPTSVPVIINNGAVNTSSITSWKDNVSHCFSLDHFSKSSSVGDSCVSNSINSSLSSKYITGIKKKNSYKDAPKLITCPMDGCVQKFPWNSSLMRHILTHTAHKPFKCTRCVKSFSTKSNRERHMTRVHRVRVNRSKFKSLQGSKVIVEDTPKPTEDGIDSENGVDGQSIQDSDMCIMELSEEEWIIMDDNDRRAEDISSNLLKLAGQPIVEPNPVRLHNVEKKIEANKYDTTFKKISSFPN